MNYKMAAETVIGMFVLLFTFATLFMPTTELPILVHMLGATVVTSVLAPPVLFVQYLLHRFKWSKEESSE